MSRAPVDQRIANIDRAKALGPNWLTRVARPAAAQPAHPQQDPRNWPSLPEVLPAPRIKMFGSQS